MGMMAKVEMSRLGAGGTSLEDLILLAAEGTKVVLADLNESDQYIGHTGTCCI